MKLIRNSILLCISLLAGIAQAATVTFTASGNWTVPAGVTSATVEAWGGGGGGGAATGNPAKGGGGAGGQYVRRVVTVVPGNIYPVVVGAGGSVGAAVAGGAGGDSTFATTSVVAKGGAGGALCSTNNCIALGGLGSAVGAVGDTVFVGGNGSDGDGATGVGGAGGGGAGSTGPGGNAAGDLAGIGTPSGGGSGAAARTTGGACGNAATVAGGGGCGGYATSGTNRSGGVGAAGQVVISYVAAPIVTTNAATSLATTTAVLNGNVNDNGGTTTVLFDYGTAPTVYVSTINAAQSPLAAGSGATPVSANISGLNCGTPYYFRVRAVNAAGTTLGAEQTFTTAACPTGLTVTASPAGCVNDASVGAVAWTLLDAVASDNSYASTSLNDNQQSNYLKCTGYGFAIPAGATINGITVNVERSATNTPIQDFRMRVLKAGVIGATDRSTATQYPTLDTVEAHGSAADLWGTTWTAADINNMNFGAALAAFKNGTNGGARTVNVDHMPITVSYTPTTPWVASINRTSPNPTAANTSVTWDVLFSGNALGVDAADFELVMGGAATGASITSVTGGGNVWTVTANTGSGATGTLGLNLVDNNTITIGGVPLGGAGPGNGDFTGQVYTLEVPVCSGTFIYCDDFERSNPGAVGSGWTIIPGPVADCAGVAGNSGCAGIDSDIPPFNVITNPRPNPTRAMFTRWSIVSVDSPVINLSGHPSALLSFWMRRGGDTFSEYPEAVGEDYLVQYFASDNTWKVLAQYPTGVMQGQVFTPTIQLPPDAMHANFKLRYYQPAGSGDANGGATGGAPGVVGYDYWHIDNVIIREAPESSYVGAFCDNFEAGLGRWSISAEGAPGLPPAVAIGDAGLNTTDFLSATHELDMRWGYVVASTLRTDITGVNGNITYWVKSGTTAVRDPDANEDLVVEYRNSAGIWTTLATYPGSAAAGAIYNGSHAIPADAQHTGFRLRFRMLNGSAFDNDYWHIDDVCVGASLTDVDLAIAKTHTGAVTPGAQATYTLTVSNPGVNALAGTISVVDTLPAGLSYQSGTGTGWTCTANGQDVTCSYVGTLNGGATAPAITLIVNVDAGASGTLTNTATVSGSAPDSNLANNTATDTVILTPGFVFTDAPCVHGLAFGTPGQTCNLFNWSPQIAGQNSADVYLTKVNTLGRPSQYVAATTVNFEFGLACHNPTTNAGVQASFSAAGSALPLCEANGAVPTNWSTGVDRTFAANTTSIGPYVFNYADVGQVELHARNSAATSQAGSSGAFVVKPGGFVLSSIVRTSDSLTNPAAADASGATFVKAGEAFTVVVTATTCPTATTTCTVAGAATPNYGRETTPESVRLTPTLVAGLGLTNNPAIGGIFGTFGLDCAGGAGTSGAACGTVFTWDEVGIIRLTPSVGDGGYLTAGDVIGTVSGNVGRFYPDHFDTVVTQVAGVPMNCPGSLTCPLAYNGIVYSGQDFNLVVTAKSASGGTTLNYVDTVVAATDFARTATLSAVSGLGIDTAPAGAGNLGVLNLTAFAAGVATAATEKYTFSTVPTTPTDIFIRATEATGGDGVSSKRLTNPTTTSIEGGVKVVSGRLRVSNAYGSERLPLTLQAVAQYFTANGWVNSTTDSVTSLTLAANYNVVKNGTITGTTTPAPTGVTTLNAGVRNIVLSAPTGGATGTAVVSPTAPSFLPVTAGSATFGVYNNNNNFIYRREN